MPPKSDFTVSTEKGVSLVPPTGQGKVILPISALYSPNLSVYSTALHITASHASNAANLQPKSPAAAHRLLITQQALDERNNHYVHAPTAFPKPGTTITAVAVSDAKLASLQRTNSIQASAASDNCSLIHTSVPTNTSAGLFFSSESGAIGMRYSGDDHALDNRAFANINQLVPGDLSNLNHPSSKSLGTTNTRPRRVVTIDSDSEDDSCSGYPRSNDSAEQLNVDSPLNPAQATPLLHKPQAQTPAEPPTIGQSPHIAWTPPNANFIVAAQCVEPFTQHGNPGGHPLVPYAIQDGVAGTQSVILGADLGDDLDYLDPDDEELFKLAKST
jgi:hypothetical protein